MAFTKAPTADTHNVRRVEPRGTPFVVSGNSVTTAEPPSLNYIDCFPRKEGMWASNPIYRIHKRESWDKFNVTGSTVTASSLPGRSIVVCEGQPYIYCPVNTYIYKVNIAGLAAPSVAVQASGVTAAWQASGTLAVNSSNVNRVCFLTNTYQLHSWDEDGTNATQTDLSAITVTGYRGLVFLNGYLFAANSAGKIYNSGVGGALTTWATTDFIVPEMYPDFVEWIDKHHNMLVAFSKNSIEFFYDGGVEVGSPLVRQESYASRIGIVHTTFPGKVVARIDDDLYFVGRNNNNVKSLYRIKDFRIEEIQNQYMNNVFNWIGSATDYQTVYGIETVLINATPMILLSFGNGYEMVYNPDDDAWWSIRTNGDTLKGYASNVNTDFPAFNYRIGYCVQPGYDTNYGKQFILALHSDSTDGMYLYFPGGWNGTPPTVVAEHTTEVVDFGINYWKHIARVDAVGDFGNNTLTLSYNFTPNYGQTYTDCAPTMQPSVDGYGNNASWYNLGAMRRGSFRLKMSGTDVGVYEGLDVEYNSGAA